MTRPARATKARRGSASAALASVIASIRVPAALAPPAAAGAGTVSTVSSLGTATHD